MKTDDDTRDHFSGGNRRAPNGKYASGEDPHPPHDRHGILKPALMDDHMPDKTITSYRVHIDPNATVKKHAKKPYETLNIEFTARDGSKAHAQVFYSNFQDHATFVRRDAGEFVEGEKVRISALLDDPKVWKISFHDMENPDHWVKEIQHCLYTPVEELPVQLKRSHFWANRGWAFEETCTEVLVKKGNLTGASNCRTTLDFGPLAGEASLARGFDALSSGTISGLTHVKTVEQFKVHLCEQNPGLAVFARKRRTEPLTISAKSVFDAVAADTANDNIEELVGYSRSVLTLAFKFGAVTGWDQVPEVPVTRDLNAFISSVRQLSVPEQILKQG